ncbi:3'(2'),5'-bisphosphate nucleotidase CysQ, partial [bacterium]|nr:3'(2'),5'-bisphosphate nucleotidase CysQ [bacterium]
MRDKIIPIAEAAGKILLKYFRSDLEVIYKNDDTFDPVTAADKESDEYIRSQLTALFPEDLILSEENDDVPTDYSKRIWMVDPLDGTNAFVSGTNTFSILIGLWEADTILFGLAYAPAANKMYVAEKGKGAFERQPDGSFKRMHVSDIESLSEARLITKNPIKDKRPLNEQTAKLKVTSIIESSRTKLARIAAGEAEVHLNTNFRASKWDTLAVQLMLEEAGGVVVDLNGNPLDYKQLDLRWE